LKYDLTVVGYIVLDYISKGRNTTGPLLGGPSIYASLAARALGASVLVLSTVGCDFDKKKFDWLRKHGIPTTNIRTSPLPTTSFKIRYKNGNRTMRVDPVCERLREDDVPLFTSTSVHIGPVLQEVPLPLALKLRERTEIMSVDPQGYVRTRLQNGTIKKSRWRTVSMLRNTDVLKISESEVSGILGTKPSARKLLKLGPRIVLLTKGREGVTLLSRDEGKFFLPAYKTDVIDPTGAGDALMGAFLFSWKKTGDLLWSAALGMAVASFVVEGFGPSNFGTRREIESRAQLVMQQSRRLA